MIFRSILMTLVLVSSASSLASEQEVYGLIQQWRTPEAAALVEGMIATLPDLPSVLEASAWVKFHQQRYADALDLLRRAAAAGGHRSPNQALIQATYETTKEHVTFPGERFTVRTPAGPDELLAPYLHEALEAAITKHGPRFGVELSAPAPVVIEVYPSLEAFSRVSTLSLDAIETSGTIALCKFDRLMIVSPRATVRGYDWLDTASHELIHLLISRRSHNQVPVWLHEGLAKSHESGWRGPYGEGLAPYSAKLLVEALRSDQLITFAQMSPSMALLPSQEATATAFAEVHTAMEYLLQVESKGVIVRLLDALKNRSGDVDLAFKDVIGVALIGFEKKWRKWLRSRKFERHDGAPAQLLAFGSNRAAADDNDPSRPEGEAGRRARLGDLLYLRGHHGAAAIEYGRSVKKSGFGFAGLVHRYAETLILSGRAEEARAPLTRSVRLAPDDPRSWVLLGRLELRQERWEGARFAYQSANRINPFDPEVHDALAQVGEKLGDESLRERALKARTLLSDRGRRRADEPVAEALKSSQKRGYLSLQSTPWAQVLIDGADSGRGTPLLEFPLSEGAHEVELRSAARGLSSQFTVVITAGKTTQKTINLSSKTAEQEHKK